MTKEEEPKFYLDKDDWIYMYVDGKLWFCYPESILTPIQYWIQVEGTVSEIHKGWDLKEMHVL